MRVKIVLLRMSIVPDCAVNKIDWLALQKDWTKLYGDANSKSATQLKSAHQQANKNAKTETEPVAKRAKSSAAKQPQPKRKPKPLSAYFGAQSSSPSSAGASSAAASAADSGSSLASPMQTDAEERSDIVEIGRAHV